MFKKIVSHTVKFVSHTLKLMPVAATGLGLGIVNIGILLSLFLNSITPSVVGLVICLLFISKIFLKNVLHFRHFISELKNPLVASFIPTISMAIMSMAVVVAYFSIDVARYVWYFGFVLHILLLISFIYHCITVLWKNFSESVTKPFLLGLFRLRAYAMISASTWCSKFAFVSLISIIKLRK